MALKKLSIGELSDIVKPRTKVLLAILGSDLEGTIKIKVNGEWHNAGRIPAEDIPEAYARAMRDFQSAGWRVTQKGKTYTCLQYDYNRK